MNTLAPYFLAHLSRRLMGERIVYQLLWHPSVVRLGTSRSTPLRFVNYNYNCVLIDFEVLWCHCHFI